MTTTEFLSSLQEKLHFLSEDDREKIVAFYASQLSALQSQEEVDRKISELGTPEDISKKVKEVADSQNAAADTEPTTVKTIGDESENTDATIVASATEEKTIVASPSEEQAMDLPESTEPTIVSSPDFDSTVVATDSSEPTVVSPASDDDSSDDVLLAPTRRTTLPRTETPAEWDHLYDDSAVEEESDASDNEEFTSKDDDEEGERVSFKRRKKSKEVKEQIEVAEEEPLEKPKKEFKPFTGSNLMDSLMKKSGKTPEESSGLFNMLRALFVLPLLLISFLLICGYLAAVGLVALVVIGLILLTLLCGLCGVAGLAYGIVSFFTESGVIAVIEVGLATILFAIVTALIALCYELIAGIIPILIKKLTDLYLWLIRWFCYKLTGRNGLGELFSSKNKK